MQQETLTPQSIHIANALASLLTNPQPPKGYRPLRRLPDWAGPQVSVKKARSAVIASLIQGGGTATRQRRRAIERHCIKAKEDPAPFIQLLEEKCNG